MGGPNGSRIEYEVEQILAKVRRIVAGDSRSGGGSSKLHEMFVFNLKVVVVVVDINSLFNSNNICIFN